MDVQGSTPITWDGRGSSFRVLRVLASPTHSLLLLCLLSFHSSCLPFLWKTLVKIGWRILQNKTQAIVGLTNLFQNTTSKRRFLLYLHTSTNRKLPWAGVELMIFLHALASQVLGLEVWASRPSRDSLLHGKLFKEFFAPISWLSKSLQSCEQVPTP